MSTSQHVEVEESMTEPVPMTPEDTQQDKHSSLIKRAKSIQARVPIIVVALAVAILTFFVHGYRLSSGPDVFSDEGLYLLVGLSVAKGGGLTINNSPFLYHPPAYFLIEAAYLKLLRLTDTDLLTALFSVRYLNIFFSAATATLLLFFGRKLHSYRAGLLMVALFLMDPYVQRINRRNMLETFTMLCLLAGFYIFFTSQRRLKTWQWLGAGIALGLMALTKEALIPYLLALVGMIFWARRTQLMDALRTIAVAVCLYACYPLWAFTAGEWHDYVALKSTEFGWVAGAPSGSSLTASSQKTFSFENVQKLLGQYATSYILVAVAGMMLLVLLLFFRQRREARFLLVWSSFSFAYVFVLARTSDQYLYFLIVPAAIITNGYGLSLLLESVRYRRWLRSGVSIFLCLLLLFNSGEWIYTYGYKSDDGYAKILAYVQTHIPPDEPIVLSDDVGYYLLPSDYTIRFDRTKTSILELRDHYFIMSSKDRWGGYNATTPEFYDWVIHNSKPILVEQENTFWTIGLYYFKGSVDHQPRLRER